MQIVCISIHSMYIHTYYLHLFPIRAVSQKIPVEGFKWIKKLSEFNEDVVKNYDENNNKGYILEVDVQYPKKIFNLYSDLPFYLKERNLKNARSLFVTYITKKTMLYT